MRLRRKYGSGVTQCAVGGDGDVEFLAQIDQIVLRVQNVKLHLEREMTSVGGSEHT